MIGKAIRESRKINQALDCSYINLTTNVFNFNKNLSVLRIIYSSVKLLSPLIVEIIKHVFAKKYDLYYITINSSGAGLLKDSIIVFLLKLFRRNNIVYHFHNKGVKNNSRNKFNKILYRFIFRGTRVILLSPLLYEDVQKYVPLNRVYFCSNGVSSTKATRNMNKTKTIPRLLFFSNMIKEKGVYDLLDACEVLKNDGFNFICDFVGKWLNITEEGFDLYVKEKQLEKIVIAHGAKYGSEKNRYFEQADIFVYPTYYHYECFPLVLLEAMQHRLPIMSTTEGAIPEIVDDGITGLLAQKQKPGDLASKIKTLLEKPSMREMMAKKGYEKYNQKYTISTFENNLCKILLKIIKDNN